MKKLPVLLFSAVILVLSAFVSPLPDEGMYPLNQINNLNLKNAGLKIDVTEIYNPDGPSLIDALVNVGGCTGSFVSSGGLILTNHHCSFGAVQRASSVEKNYLENGFLAETPEDEIPASGITCRIAVSYKDVSAEVLEAAGKGDDIFQRSKAIQRKIREIVKEENSKNPDLECKVSEMFAGESYILFRHKVINDVRLVYVPPRDIGEFGGETDNWVWPRHTGDFSFLRAYVAPDGSSASYSKDNIPFSPKKYLRVNPRGVEEGDFVFILGYPGRTYKNQPARFVEYQEKYELPFLQSLYSWMINMYQSRGENDPEYALKISSKIKSLANSEKNYRGKMMGLKRIKLVSKKLEEEKELQNFINDNAELKEKYGNITGEIDDIYNQIFDFGILPPAVKQLSRQLSYYRLAELLLENEKEVNEVDTVKIPEDNKKSEKLAARIEKLYEGIDRDQEIRIFAKILSEIEKYPETISLIQPGSSDIKSFAEDLYNSTLINNKEKFIQAVTNASLTDFDDPFINFVRKVEDAKAGYDSRMSILEPKLDLLLSKFIEVKRYRAGESSVPDANSTLRLTYGYVSGYSPSDALYYSPITTLSGVVEKGTPEGDYRINKKLVELYNKKDFGNFVSKKLNDVPVGILYNTDTSGGNSGSPVFDAWGNLVALNFDRAFEATINDYAWNEAYSRSIGVDVRYILWVTQKIGGADNILQELGIL